MTTPVFERVRVIASDIFGLPQAAITAGSAPENVETWDSVRHLSLILALEETFQLQLSPEETERIQTVGRAAELVEEKLRTAAG